MTIEACSKHPKAPLEARKPLQVPPKRAPVVPEVAKRRVAARDRRKHERGLFATRRVDVVTFDIHFPTSSQVCISLL